MQIQERGFRASLAANISPRDLQVSGLKRLGSGGLRRAQHSRHQPFQKSRWYKR